MDTIKICEIDCTANTKTCGKYGVRGYPTIKLFIKGQVYDYEGARETDALKKWAETMIRPMFAPITEQEYTEKAGKLTQEVHFVLYAPAEDADKYETYLASIKGKYMIFYVISDTPRLVAVRNGDRITHSGQMTSGPMKFFIDQNQFGFFPDLLKGYQKLIARPSKLPVFIVLNKEYHEDIKNEMYQLDRKFTLEKPAELEIMKKFNLVYVDENGNAKSLVQKMVVPEGDAPYAVFFDGKDDKNEKYFKVPLDAEKNVTQQVIAAMQNFQRKQLISINATEPAHVEPKKTEEHGTKAAAIDPRAIEQLKGFISSKFAQYNKTDNKDMIIFALLVIVFVQALALFCKKPAAAPAV